MKKEIELLKDELLPIVDYPDKLEEYFNKHQNNLDVLDRNDLAVSGFECFSNDGGPKAVLKKLVASEQIKSSGLSQELEESGFAGKGHSLPFALNLPVIARILKTKKFIIAFHKSFNPRMEYLVLLKQEKQKKLKELFKKYPFRIGFIKPEKVEKISTKKEKELESLKNELLPIVDYPDKLEEYFNRYMEYGELEYLKKTELLFSGFEYFLIDWKDSPNFVLKQLIDSEVIKSNGLSTELEKLELLDEDDEAREFPYFDYELDLSAIAYVLEAKKVVIACDLSLDSDDYSFMVLKQEKLNQLQELVNKYRIKFSLVENQKKK